MLNTNEILLCKRCNESFQKRRVNQKFCDAYCQITYNKNKNLKRRRAKRMKNEADFKRIFCNSVEKQGGYSFKIAMSIMSGLPDLYCIMPGFVPVLLEAKWIKDVGAGTFKRKIPYRPFQREILHSCNKVSGASGLVAFGLIGIDTEEEKYCVLINPMVEIITHDDIMYNEILIGKCKIENNFIDVMRLFSSVVPTSMYVAPQQG